MSLRAAPFRRDGAYAWYVAAVLALCQMVSFIDRQLINLLVEPIKQDLNLDDTSISLLIGVAFTSVHILLAVPLGRMVDRGSRRAMIFVCGICWSLSSMAGGLVSNYEWLFLSRVGVGAAEAGIYPATAALVAAYFTRERLPRAMSIMLLGPFVGGGLSLIFGGLVIGALERIGPTMFPVVGLLRPWQMTLVLVTVAGILPILMILSVREPPRTDAGEQALQIQPSMRAALAYLAERAPFYGYFYAGIALHVVAIYAVPAWAPAMLTRKFGMSLQEVGVSYGAVTLIAGVGGMLTGPFLARWVRSRGHRDSSIRAARLAVALCLPFALALPFATSPDMALMLLFGLTFCYTMPLPLASAALQEITPDRLRGFAGALYFVALSLVGLGLAPTVVGLVTDHLQRDPAAVGTSLGLVVAGAGIAAILLLGRATAGYGACLRELTPIDRAAAEDLR